MARRGRAVSLASAIALATALTGAAVFTVAEAQCAQPGRFVERGGQVELLGGCVERADLPQDARVPRQAAEQDGGPLGSKHW